MRRKESGLDIVASLPWPIGLAVGVMAFGLVRYIIPGFLIHSASPITQAMGKAFANTLAPLAWFVMAVCWIAAGVSFARARRRKQLLDTPSGLDSLAALSWREFEMLVGEAYRRLGYEVEETGLGGKDGGIDLILRRAGTKELVQCKQWRSRQVNAACVREMWGLVDHFEADAVKIVCIGEFTRDAMKFAEGKRIELVNGARLVALVESVQSALRDAPPAAKPEVLSQVIQTPPDCPKCGEAMLRRHNRATRQAFWGCGKYPVCKGTRQLEEKGS